VRLDQAATEDRVTQCGGPHDGPRSAGFQHGGHGPRRSQTTGDLHRRSIAARLAARLRPRPPPPIVIGELRIDWVERRVARAGRPLALLPREYALLLHLARAGGRCVDRAELLEAVWRLHFDPGTNVIEVHVSRLRAKLDRGFARPLLVTEKGRGYRLMA